MQAWLALGWGVVLAWLASALLPERALRLRRGMSVVSVLWAFLPGEASFAYWLGLPFHAPSVVAVLWCALALKDRLRIPPVVPLGPVPFPPVIWWLMAVLMGLGWMLLLDTLALLPFEMYAWGFGPAVLALAALVGLIPWVLKRQGGPRFQPVMWVPGVAVAFFAALRLPTGNVWDALLDPLLWVYLHILLWRFRPTA
jgi:hypothetical protein